MNKAAGQPGDGACKPYHLEIDNAPVGDGAGLLPRITVRGCDAPEGVLVCIGALMFGAGGSGGAAVSPIPEIGA